MLLITLVTSIFLLTLSILAVAGRHFFLPKKIEDKILPVRQPPSLFPVDDEVLARIAAEETAQIAAAEFEKLTARAGEFDLAVLLATENKIFQNKLLETLTTRAETDDDIRVLAAFVSTHNFNVNQLLIAKFERVWQTQPTRKDTVELLHLAALSDDASVFQRTAEIICERFDSSNDVLKLIESHFWLLSHTARNSGAGFLLKQKLTILLRR